MKPYTIILKHKKGHSKRQIKKWAKEIAPDCDKEVIEEVEE